MSKATQPIPLFRSANKYRIEFTLDSVANIFSNTKPTSFTLSNLELCYSVIKPTPQIYQQIMNKPVTTIKTEAFITSSQIIVSGQNGSYTLPFSMSYSSVKSVFFHFSGTDLSGNNLNNIFDSYDPTSAVAIGAGAQSGGGQYNLSIANKQFPVNSLNSSINKGGIYSALLDAIGGVQNPNVKTSITQTEYLTGLANNGSSNYTATTFQTFMSKFYLGFNTQRSYNDNQLLSGTDTQSNPILLRINSTVATAKSLNCVCVALVDILIDVYQNGQLILRQ